MNPKPLITILRRSLKSQYKTFLLNNRMLMQCYTIDEDDDIGFHYILHIPDTEEYTDPFYDETLILEPKEILARYTVGHRALLEKKREVKAKPKEVKEELHFKISGHTARLKFLFYVQDELVDTQLYETPYPVSPIDPTVETIGKTYYDMISRIKAGGIGVAFDGSKYNLYEQAMKYPEIYFFKVKLRDTKIRIPIYKSMFVGLKDWTEFFISIQETELPGIYVYAVHFTAKGITEQFIGYIQNF